MKRVVKPRDTKLIKIGRNDERGLLVSNLYDFKVLVKVEKK